MQIYLQKISKKRTRKISIILLFTIICLILTASAIIKSNINIKNTTKVQALYTKFAKEKDIQKSKQVVPIEELPKKMNKEGEVYSFSGEKTEKTAKGGINISSEIRVLCNDGTTRIMNIEQYTLGCLIAEMPLNFEAQALMAQSVAIRSFTAKKTLTQSNAHPDADVCTDYRCCQSYLSPSDKNASDELIAKASHAVNATRGIIAVVDGKPIEAVYHASSGYSTRSSAEVWGGELSYLKSVKAPEGEAELTKKETAVSYDKLSNNLSNYSEKAVKCGSFGENITVFESDGNLCQSISINSQEFSKNILKSSLGLTSNDFKIEKNEDGLKITCYGNGHRVGLSQHGANLLAKEGKSYAEILKYYYTGINLGFISSGSG